MSGDMIHTPERLKQIIDYSGLTYGNIHPTDIDSLFEFDNEYLILVEVKVKTPYGVNVPIGQKIAYHNTAIPFAQLRKGAMVVYCTHDTKPEERILLKDTIIDSIFNASTEITTNLSTLNITFKDWLRTLVVHWPNKKLMGIITGDIK